MAVRTSGGLECSLRNIAVERSSSRANTCERELIAVKNSMIHRMIACVRAVREAPPDARLMPSVATAANDNETLSA